MNCPICNHDSRVLKTTETERRRECTVCGHRFTSVEILKDDLQRKDRIIAHARELAVKVGEAV